MWRVLEPIGGNIGYWGFGLRGMRSIVRLGRVGARRERFGLGDGLGFAGEAAGEERDLGGTLFFFLNLASLSINIVPLTNSFSLAVDM